MKLLLSLAVIAIALLQVQSACPEISNCDSCSNKGVLCDYCVDHTIISYDRTACLDCMTGCDECEADEDDVVSCTSCFLHYYLAEDHTCTECPEGCTTCHEDETGVVHCDECYAEGYVMDKTSETGECLACPSNCKRCSVNDDLTTKCEECYSYQGLGIRGYYKDADNKCKSCPSNCEKCDTNGLCGNCFDHYEPLDDEDDDTKDKTKCVKCPAECDKCNGVEISSGTATCESCVQGEGNYLSDGECISCDANCINCNDDGDCIECDIEYRLDSGSCTACPAFCEQCTDDESLAIVVCDTCEEGYGEKLPESITCDVCTTPNCASCTRLSDGSMTCQTCKDGFGIGSDSKCTSCPSGCLTCTYDSTYMKCDTCKEGYTADIFPLTGASTAADPSLCGKCPTGCKTCEFGGSAGIECLTCTSDTGYIDDSGANDVCSELPSNCDEAASGTCSTCSDGYFNAPTCTACGAALNCETCSSATECDTCKLGFGMIDTDLDNSTEACEACGISNCERCFAEGGFQGYPKKCWQCADGYAIYDPDTSSAVVGTACKKCPTGCETCTVDYSDSDKTKCTSGGCYAWDEKKAYTDGETGECEQCGSNCEDCTYDSSDESVTCDADGCTDGYTDTPEGECEECPEHCDACDYDDSLSAIVCDDGECDVGYGNADDGTCGECPVHCDECSYEDDDEDAVLHCDTCSSGYVDNDDVCADCPSNCILCDDEEGSMVCKECDDHYALDSDKACVKCVSNCDVCTATKCTSCLTGFALASDGLSCIACNEAAFDNCVACGNVNAASGKAECDLCGSGYVLEDGAKNISCVDASSLSCGSGTYSDKPAECDTCAADYELTEDYHCAKLCYQCGDVETNTYVSQDECIIPELNGSNSTDSVAPLIPCVSGVCYGAYKDGKVMGGCMPSSYTACSDDANAGETCQSVIDDERCERCCSDTECNTWLEDLDGMPDSGATGIMINIFLLISLLVLNM